MIYFSFIFTLLLKCAPLLLILYRMSSKTYFLMTTPAIDVAALTSLFKAAERLLKPMPIYI